MRVEIKNNKERVIKLLEDKPHLRDDDQKLMANIWFQDLLKSNINAKDITGYKLLEIFSKSNILSNPESVRRVRQKVQEENVNLRGNNYKSRHKNEEKIKKELNYG